MTPKHSHNDTHVHRYVLDHPQIIPMHLPHEAHSHYLAATALTKVPNYYYYYYYHYYYYMYVSPGVYYYYYYYY